MTFLKEINNSVSPLRPLGHGNYQYSDAGKLFKEKDTALKYSQEWEGHVETINHKQVIKIKSVFLIKNKCLINLEHIDLRTQVKSKRVMTEVTWSTACCVFSFQSLGGTDRLLDTVNWTVMHYPVMQEWT